jgi:hypothetical protein
VLVGPWHGPEPIGTEFLHGWRDKKTAHWAMHPELKSVRSTIWFDRNWRENEKGAFGPPPQGCEVEVLLSGLTITFLKELGIGVWLTLPVLLTLALAITLLGQIAGRSEGWQRFDSFYWAFITATTVGYGDLRPTRVVSKLIAILIGLLGLTFTGIVIAIAVHAGTVALAAHDAAAQFK